MQPIGNANNGTAPRATRVSAALVRVGIAVTVMLGGTGALVSSAGAGSTASELPEAEASNGGVASSTTGGEVNIGQIVTGENTGNSIVTGDVAGSAEINGGDIDYPTDVTVSLELGPPVATADGGDGGTATASDDDSQDKSTDQNSGSNGEDITIINRNENRNKSSVVEETKS